MLKNPSANRNQGPILEILNKVLNQATKNLTLLEISSGTGQHVSYFARNFPNITFQPSEVNESMFPSIRAFINNCPTKNICQPMKIDITTPAAQWGRNNNREGPFFIGNSHQDFNNYVGIIDYMLNINMIHITPIECAEGLFRNAGLLLKPFGMLITYGPYGENGIISPESNVNFNAMLQSQNPEWGVRDITELKKISKSYGVEFQKMFDLPANNKCIIWQKVDNK